MKQFKNYFFIFLSGLLMCFSSNQAMEECSIDHCRESIEMMIPICMGGIFHKICVFLINDQPCYCRCDFDRDPSPLSSDN